MAVEIIKEKHIWWINHDGALIPHRTSIRCGTDTPISRHEEMVCEMCQQIADLQAQVAVLEATVLAAYRAFCQPSSQFCKSMAEEMLNKWAYATKAKSKEANQ